MSTSARAALRARALSAPPIPSQLGAARMTGASAVVMRGSVAAAAGHCSPRPAAAVTGSDRSLERVVIELDPAQVDEVVRASSQEGAMSVLLGGLEGFREALSHGARAGESGPLDDRRLSRSLLSGLLVLSLLPADGSYVGIVEMAQSAGMHNSKVHRYVTTLVAAGLVQRDPATRRYRLVSNVCEPGRG
jgi:predicted transcriptional regulator